MLIMLPRFLLIDSRPRRVGLVLDSAVPLPLLSSVLDTLFNNFQTPIISLMSTPTMAVVGAGVRSALVVDMGWNETVVTSVYEYREVRSSRSVRGGRSLNDTLYRLLHGLIPTAEEDDESEDRAVTFEECEDILCRLMWCRPSSFKTSQRQSTQLDTVEEQDENEGESNQPTGIAEVPLRSTTPPWTIHIPFNKLADVCDDAFFDPSAARSTFDDHELPLHLLVYHHLLQLPLDVRAICMSRIIFTGGCSNILGVKERIVDEMTSIVERRGWEPVFGKSVEHLRNSQRAQRKGSIQRSSMSSVGTSDSGGDDSDGLRSESGTTDSQEDQVEAKIARNRPIQQQFQGQLRAIHSLGAWSGASLMCQLKIPAMATVDRELWLQQGVNGACRPGDVDMKNQQRQSMGAASLIRGSGGHHSNWTLGVWGTL
jgi:actin-related protein